MSDYQDGVWDLDWFMADEFPAYYQSRIFQYVLRSYESVALRCRCGQILKFEVDEAKRDLLFYLFHQKLMGDKAANYFNACLGKHARCFGYRPIEQEVPTN